MKPMLAATMLDTATIQWPVMASPKLDGIRCIIIDGVPVTRNLKDIPNDFIRETLLGLDLPQLDGELIVGNPTNPDCYRVTNSGVMSKDGHPDWHYHIFDKWDEPLGFGARLKFAKAFLQWAKHPRLRIVPHLRVECEATLLSFEQNCLRDGHEGIMGRSLGGAYKHGRATLREGSLWKLKRFIDGEATIVGFEERMHNANSATKDALGRTKRSSHKENKHGMDTLGALLVADTGSGVRFDIGTGLSDDERADIWANREQWLGRTVKYKSFPVGVKDKPRFPVYLGERKDL